MSPSAQAPAGHQLIDLLHLGRAGVIGTWRVGPVIIDPGPASCLERLLPALAQDPPAAIALTHIHLDHAGATGSLLSRFPQLEVWVHERGAPHMADPSRLLASAQRLYGSRMQELWGEMLPVPAERIRVLKGGETVHGMQVAYTPGHASHHVSYLHLPSRWAFTGDVAGVRMAGSGVLAPTPPPDIDLPAWRRSLELVEAWHPSTLAVTHFGAYADVQAHLAALRANLQELERMAGELDQEQFARAVRERVAASGDQQAPGAYAQAVDPAQSYAGLRRYLDRAAERG